MRSVGFALPGPCFRRRSRSIQTIDRASKIIFRIFCATECGCDTLASQRGSHLIQTQTVMLIFQDDQASESFASQYSAVLRRCVHLAWDDWKGSPLSAQMQTTSIRAQYVNNQIIYRGKQETEGLDDICVDKIHGNYGFVIQNRVFVRPKFARQNYRSSNFPTKSAIAFHDQSIDLFGGIARLELIYTLNSLGTLLQDVCLSQRQKNKTMWLLPLRDATESHQANLVPLPTPERQGTAADRILKTRKKSHDSDQQDQPKRGDQAV